MAVRHIDRRPGCATRRAVSIRELAELLDELPPADRPISLHQDVGTFPRVLAIFEELGVLLALARPGTVTHDRVLEQADRLESYLEAFSAQHNTR